MRISINNFLNQELTDTVSSMMEILNISVLIETNYHKNLNLGTHAQIDRFKATRRSQIMKKKKQL